MNIFWIKAGPLYPLDTGGKIRTWNILKELGKRNDVTVFSFFPAYMGEPQDSAGKYVSRLVSMPVDMPEKYSFEYYFDYLRKLPSTVPYVVRQNELPEVQKLVHVMLQKASFDVVICDFLFPCLNLPEKMGCPKVLFAHNAETMIWQRHFKVARSPFRRAVFGLEYRKMKIFEGRQCSSFDHLIAVSDIDRKWFARYMPASQISVIPTGVDLEYFIPSPAPSNPSKLIFTGSMDWLANEDAILYFEEKVLPRIVREIPSITLTVAGRDPTDQLLAMAKRNSRIRFTGTVPDVRPYVHEAAVYVLPLQVGSGTRLKIFEAMAMGKAVVSTRVGAEGLPVISGKHLLLADEPEAFASSVVQLIKDQQLRQQLGHAARRLVEDRYGWPEVGRTFQDILESAVTHRNLQPEKCSPKQWTMESGASPAVENSLDES